MMEIPRGPLMLAVVCVFAWFFIGQVYVKFVVPASTTQTPYMKAEVPYFNLFGDHAYDKRPTSTTHSNVQIALGMGMTFRKMDMKKFMNQTSHSLNFDKVPFFATFLPSFCKTISAGFDYNFYIAYDYNEALLMSGSGREEFKKSMRKHVHQCNAAGVGVTIRLISVPYSGHPAWAQNDAMVEAYHDNNDYFYMANDDTRFVTTKWSEAFTSKLSSLTPPNVGTVGPSHTGGAQGIMTYNFVHRTHFSIFHFFYPRDFKDWFADNWMSNVYPKANHHQLKNIKVNHLMGEAAGRRYNLSDTYNKLAAGMQKVLKETKPMVLNYIKYKQDLFGERLTNEKVTDDKLTPKKDTEVTNDNSTPKKDTEVTNDNSIPKKDTEVTNDKSAPKKDTEVTDDKLASEKDTKDISDKSTLKLNGTEVKTINSNKTVS